VFDVTCITIIDTIILTNCTNDAYIIILQRVDWAVKRLSQLRHWAREEARSRRGLEAVQAGCTEEIDALRTNIDTISAKLRATQGEGTRIGRELGEAVREGEEGRVREEELKDALMSSQRTATDTQVTHYTHYIHYTKHTKHTKHIKHTTHTTLHALHTLHTLH
jgi:uncharacterized coiled-coil DUF342 family protein